jgi:translocation and assembly module TamB
MRRRWVLAIVAALLLALVAGPVVVVHRLLTTERGLHWALAQLVRLPAVRIEAHGASGTLAGPLTLQRLVVDHDAVHIEARGVRVDLRVASLLHGDVHFEQSRIDRLNVTLKRRDEQPPEQPHFLPQFLEVAAPDLRLGHVTLTLADDQAFSVQSLRGALAMTRWRIDLTDIVADDPAGRIDGALALRATLPLGLRVAANGHWRLPDDRTYRFAAAARGNLDRLATTVTLAEPANLSFVGTVLTLGSAPRAVGTLRATDFDGTPWLPQGQWPRMSGSIALDARPDAFGLDGTVTADAFGDGPVRLQGNGRWAGRTLEVVSLQAWLPRSSLAVQAAGSVTLGDSLPTLALSGEWTALRWPLTGAPSVESALGTFSLQGSMPYAFDVQAHVRAPVLDTAPEADFTATGTFDREQLVLERLQGAVSRGRLSASGRVNWAGEQPWNAQVDARDIDISGLRADLSGRVSTVATIDGRGFTLDAPWTARLASLSGTVRGRALTGRGEVAHRDGNYDLRNVRIAHGPSHIDVNGRWGSTIDLRWSADVRSLSLLHPDLAGELLSAGRAHGAAARPQIDAELQARGLGIAGVTVASLDADLDVDATDRRDSRVAVRASGIDLGVVVLDAAQLDARGRTHVHTMELQFTSKGDEARQVPGFRGGLGVSGAYEADRRTWLGSLDDASVTFPDGSATLLQPAAIEAGPALARLAPVCLQTGDARLCAEGERRADPESWRVLYSAQDWPLQRLLRSILGWREFDGRLQAAGWAAQEPGQTWTGGMTLLLDEPTLDIPRNKFRTERIELGSGRLDVFMEPTELRASVDLRLAETTRVQGEVMATRDAAVATLDYPLRGSIRGESSALTAIPVFVPEIDRSSGKLDATVSIGGTLGAPRFDGEFHVRDGRFDMYRSNMQLAGVRLDGRFVGDELVFDGDGKTARGTLAFDGRFAWPAGVMTGELHLKGDQLQLADTPDFRIVASPDLTIAAGTDGYAVRGEVLIPFARITPRDLSTTVTTSPDERIVGMEVIEQGPSTLERIRLRVRMVLGDDVRVDSHGLKAQLAGAVTVLSRPGDVVRGNGSIRVVEGEYKAFGQFVRITRGVLSYNRTPINEPTLDLVGERTIRAEDIVVRINVRGTLAEPFVTLSSEPPMSQAEALSYLLTGRSINTLQSGEAASLDRAAESLALGGGGLLLGGIGNRIGLDEVSVEQTSDEDTAVVLGKYLSPNLFVSYGISIAEAINTIKLRYTLNERWSLKAEAGLHQSADVEYRIER